MDRSDESVKIVYLRRALRPSVVAMSRDRLQRVLRSSTASALLDNQSEFHDLAQYGPSVAPRWRKKVHYGLLTIRSQAAPALPEHSRRVELKHL